MFCNIDKKDNVTRVKRRMISVVNFFVHLAHLSQRLIGELIEYPCSGMRRRRCRCCRCRPSTVSRGTEVYINGPGHMTNMAATPIW